MAAALTAATLLFVVVGDRLWSQSVDFAHHFALVARLYELGSMPPKFDVSLGEMNVYPRYAHLVAAAFERLIGSPLLGMHVMGLLAVILLWYAIASIIRHEADDVLSVQTLLLLAALGLAHPLRFPIHGNEMVVNYFFAQIVAQALMLLVLAVWLRRAHHLGATARYAQ